jgi:uncharacterized membrane protein (UPF0127 family)
MSLNKLILIFIAILVLFGGIVYFQFSQGATPKTKITIGKQVFLSEVVKTPQDLQKGLSGRNSLGQDRAMLFVFAQPGNYAFWMKDMKIPLDMLFIKGTKIVTIAQNVPAPKDATSSLPQYNPTEPIDKVLEINAGLSKKYGFKVGDTIKVDLQN